MLALGVGTANYVRAVAETLEHAHRTFVWDHPSFVAKALQAADEHDEQCRRAIRGSLYNAVRKDGSSELISGERVWPEVCLVYAEVSGDRVAVTAVWRSAADHPAFDALWINL